MPVLKGIYGAPDHLCAVHIFLDRTGSKTRHQCIGVEHAPSYWTARELANTSTRTRRSAPYRASKLQALVHPVRAATMRPIVDTLRRQRRRRLGGRAVRGQLYAKAPACAARRVAIGGVRQRRPPRREPDQSRLDHRGRARSSTWRSRPESSRAVAAPRPIRPPSSGTAENGPAQRRAAHQSRFVDDPPRSGAAAASLRDTNSVKSRTRAVLRVSP